MDLTSNANKRAVVMTHVRHTKTQLQRPVDYKDRNAWQNVTCSPPDLAIISETNPTTYRRSA